MSNGSDRDVTNDHYMQFEFARAGARRCLVRLRDGFGPTANLHDYVTAAFTICSLGAGYAAATSIEPRPDLDASEYDLFWTSAHNPWEAEQEAATDFARLMSQLIADTADWLDLAELTAAVPLLRAALFVQVRQHFGQDCDLNPPLIQHWCSGLDTALKQGQPVEAILNLQAMRDRILPSPATAPERDATSSQRLEIKNLLDHDPGPALDEDDAQPELGTIVPFMREPAAVEADAASHQFRPVIRSGVEIPITVEMAAYDRLSQQQADLLVGPEADPLHFARVGRHLRLTIDRISSIKRMNNTIRRRRLHLVPPVE